VTRPRPVPELARVASAFGPAAAKRKLRRLAAVERCERHSVRDLALLQDTLGPLLAYPDDLEVLTAARAVRDRLRAWLAATGADPEWALQGTGFPGTVVRGEVSLALLQRLERRLPGAFEIDWDEFVDGDEDRLAATLGQLVTPGEVQALDDTSTPLRDWFAAVRPAGTGTDLAHLLALFAGSGLEDATRDHVFETTALPLHNTLRTPGTGRVEVAWPVRRVHYQKADFDRRLVAPRRVIARGFDGDGRVSAAVGGDLIHLAQRALGARGLEIRTLSYANDRDVSLHPCGRGLAIALIGVVPRFRDPLESHYFFLVLKNGVPIAYGPSTVSLGCCEVGINLFPEFRGAEIRYLYPQFMRVLHHALGARYFFLTPYGMGESNPAAIRTGAFWFYRKLGFRPTNPDVEELALAEEERMRREPGHRSSRAVLRRLSHTSAYLDLSGGECRRLDLGGIGQRQARFVEAEFDGDRRRAARVCVRRVARALGVTGVSRLGPDERRAWELLAPLLARIPGLAQWSARDRRALGAILRAKGGASERDVDRRIRAHRRLVAALREL
jgi:hypothetical protein